MKKVIINADDFGLSKSINKGIIKAYREGILTSASLIVNMPGFEDAVELIRSNPGLDVGLHINFFRGKPVLPPSKIKSFTDKKGYFLQGIFKILKQIYFNRDSLLELELECEAQIKKALDKHIVITHLDSEKHFHLIGNVYAALLKLMHKYKIYNIRNINELPYISKFSMKRKLFLNSAFYKTSLSQFLSVCKKRINLTNSIKTTDYSFGLFAAGNMTIEKYEILLSNLKEGTTEIICHPGYIDEEWKSLPLSQEKYYINESREKELDALLSSRAKEIIRQLNISLVNYKES